MNRLFSVPGFCGAAFEYSVRLQPDPRQEVTVTVESFRRTALALSGASEGAHMGHPDFRVDRRVFASLHSDNQFGMVKLTPEQQASFIENHAAAFAPEAGAWGRNGCTRVRLETVDEDALGEALTLAWRMRRRSK